MDVDSRKVKEGFYPLHFFCGTASNNKAPKVMTDWHVSE